MTKKKSSITVRKAVELVFDEMPDKFNAPFLCWQVKVKTNRQYLMDGTILRRLREARAEKQEYDYRCIDPTISLYRKVSNGKEI